MTRFAVGFFLFTVPSKGYITFTSWPDQVSLYGRVRKKMNESSLSYCARVTWSRPRRSSWNLTSTRLLAATKWVERWLEGGKTHFPAICQEVSNTTTMILLQPYAARKVGRSHLCHAKYQCQELELRHVKINGTKETRRFIGSSIYKPLDTLGGWTIHHFLATIVCADY